MKNKWLVIAVLFPLLSFPQDKTATPRINTTATAGLIAGESTAKPLLQGGVGLRFNRWYTGVGVGADMYKFNSIPLYAEGRVNLGKKQAFFAYAQCGYNFADQKAVGVDETMGKTSDRYTGGFYMDAGAGCRVPFKSLLHRLLFSAGYSRKDIVNRVGYTSFCPLPSCGETFYTYHYSFGRIVVKLSWEFGK